MTERNKIGWKVCDVLVQGKGFHKFYDRAAIVKLKIMGDWIQPRFDGPLQAANYSNKCRTSKAKVLKIELIKRRMLTFAKFKNSKVKVEARSMHERAFVYKVGKIVKPTEKFNTRSITCASGIHFFWTKKQAERY